MTFLVAVWFAATLQSCAAYLPEADFDFGDDDKGSFVTYLELSGHRLKLVSFRDGFLWYLVGLQSLAILAAVRLRSRVGLLPAIVLPMSWMLAIVGVSTPGRG